MVVFCFPLSARIFGGVTKVKPVDFRSGANPLGPSNKAKTVLRKLVRRVGDFTPDPASTLRRSIARKESVAVENVVIGNGSTHILDALLTLLKPGTATIPKPVSPRYEEMLMDHGVALKPLRFDPPQDFAVDPDELIEGLTESDLAILPHPHDMTGAVVPDEDLARITEEVDRCGKAMVLDEGSIDYTGVVSPIGRVVASRGVVILRTFSTFYGLGGLRVGYAIGPASLIREVASAIKPYHMNILGPQAALASLRDKGFRRRTLLFIEGEKAYLREKLSRIDGVKCYVSTGNLVIARIGTRGHGVNRAFLSGGLLVDDFVDDRGDLYIKVPVRSRRLNALFVRTLARVVTLEAV